MHAAAGHPLQKRPLIAEFQDPRAVIATIFLRFATRAVVRTLITRAIEASSKPLAGIPGPTEVPGYGLIQFGPVPAARMAAAAYMHATGRTYTPPVEYVLVEPRRAARIAQEYERMPHDPHHPAVQAAYRALISETLAQYAFIKSTGLKIEIIRPGSPNPYDASLRLAQLDVERNNHLWLLPTAYAFGSNSLFDARDNPLRETTEERLGDYILLANDVFRIVHDYFGHFKEGNGFRADGEENAWRSHAAMYSPLARRAMTTETRGQNCWVNFGPYGEYNRTASPDATRYADQKTGLMPDWTMIEGSGQLLPQD